MRLLRYLYRVPWLLWHVAIDLPITLLLMARPFGDLRVHGERLEHRVVRRWSRRLVRIFGLRTRRVGTPLPGATLFVANHISWIDIVVLHSQRMMGFVAKHEIRGWPLVGWMARHADTLFHRRGSQASLGTVSMQMFERLRSGRSVGVFPEGGTRSGAQLGPFHARIFAPAVEADAPVQPVALRYGEGGAAQTLIAFQPGESFLRNLLRVLGEPARPVDVLFLAPIQPGDAEGRRRIADTARARIAAALGQA